MIRQVWREVTRRGKERREWRGGGKGWGRGEAERERERDAFHCTYPAAEYLRIIAHFLCGV